MEVIFAIMVQVRHARAATESGRPVTSSSAPWTARVTSWDGSAGSCPGSRFGPERYHTGVTGDWIMLKNDGAHAVSANQCWQFGTAPGDTR